MVNYYPLLSRWDTASDEERGDFKEVIRGIVGYDCKVACDPNEGVVDIHVLCVATNKVKDILIMSSNGGLAILTEDDEITTNDACDAFNAANGVEYDSDRSDGSDDSEDSE
jgi:hypothetical protein